jgi:TRAP-type C4-dicarboxylate transport system permease small subunit
MLNKIDRGLSLAESLADCLAAAAMFLTMVIVGSEVVARYVMNAPLAWAFDVLTLYVMPAIFFLGLPGSYAKNAHIAVDILVQRLPKMPLAVTTLLVHVCALALFGCIFYFGVGFTLESYRSGDTFTGVLKFLAWPSAMLVPIGCGLVLLRILSQLPHDVISLLNGGERAPGTADAERTFVE